ncbi:hypothetical protein [Pseudescherichia vulneris]|uniref:hypothetical protein n=1 Tax=Pseudescherichia vulneris TaxID=566 RepID=UPI0028D2583C|nr:hypothetical protein [Pseudescherichia vulneris]
MKLIEILARDLHKFGGWPEGADECHRFMNEAEINFYDRFGEWEEDCLVKYGAFAIEAERFDAPPCEYEIVTRQEYEAALAASKEMLVNKPVAWDGQGFPPVGCECELYDCEKWIEVRIKYTGDDVVVVNEFGSAHSERVFHLAKKPENFRPIRTEAERKRSDICDKIYGAMTNAERKDNRSDMAEAVYDAIAAGKIPGVKLEAPDA